MKAFAKVVLVLILSALVGLSAAFMLETGLTRIHSVDLYAEQGEQPQILFRRIESDLSEKLKSLEGLPIWKVSIRKVLRLVESDQRVKSAVVRRVFPNKLSVEVHPHWPMLGWLSQEGEIYPIALDGSLLPALPTYEAPDLAILRGKEFKLNQKLREKTVNVFMQLPEKGIFSRQSVSEVLYDKQSGYEFLLAKDGMSVKMGTTNIGQKSSRVEKVLHYLNTRQIKGRVIDARFSKKVVVRLRNGP